MANSNSARKRARQAAKHRLHNASFRSRYRSAIKDVLNAINGGDAKKAQEAFKIAVPVLDSVSRKGLMHPNKTARHKSRLSAQIRAMS